MRHLKLSLALLLAVAGSAYAQNTPDTAKRAGDVQTKILQMQLYVQILPLALTKQQIRELLPELEKIRAEQRTIMKQEADELIKLETALDEANKAAAEKGVIPTRELQDRVLRVGSALAVRRRIALEAYATQLLTLSKKVMNAGQVRAMVGTVDAKLLNPTKPEEVTEDQRAKAYIKEYLLAPLAYDLLVQMSKGE